MRALIEANRNTGIDILTQSEYDALVKSSTTLYIIGSIASGNVTITNVYVGTVAQDILLDNNNVLVWKRDTITQTELNNVAVDIADLV